MRQLSACDHLRSQASYIAGGRPNTITLPPSFETPASRGLLRTRTYLVATAKVLTLVKPRISNHAAPDTSHRVQPTFYYSIGFRNLFDFGSPCAIRPASARLPRKSARSFQLSAWSRPAESFQVSPAFCSNVATSESWALVYFCSRTPRPRAISGTWSSGKTTILWLVPITAT